MKEACSRSVEREGENGLIIISALYGRVSKQIDLINYDTDNVIDVVMPLQSLVNNHALLILSSTTKVKY